MAWRRWSAGGNAASVPTVDAHVDVSSADHQRLAAIIEGLASLEPVKILLFGSTARGDAGPWSDLDVIVVATRVPERFLDRIALAYDLLDPHYALDILIYTPEEYRRMFDDGNPLITAAEEEGQVVHARPPA